MAPNMPHFESLSTALPSPRIEPRGLLARLVLAAWPLCFAALVAACGGSPGGSESPSAAVTRPTPVSDSSNSTTAAYGVLGTATVRVAFPSPGGVMPFLLENRGTQPITWGGPADGTGLPPTVSLTFAIDACAVSSSENKAVCFGFASSRVPRRATDPNLDTSLRAVRGMVRFVRQR